jgi:transcriptional regulator of arginine metabolism
MPIDQAIIEIITGEQVGDQRALIDRLSRLGFTLTQPALSRRLRKLRVQKRGGVYVKPEPAAAMPPFTLVESPPNLVVLRTTPGFAQPMALAVDRAAPPGFAGSVAGDDTIFFAATSPGMLPSLLQSIERLLRNA